MQSMVARRRKHYRGCFVQPRIVCKMRWSDTPTSGRQRNGNGKRSDRRSGHISKMNTLARLFRPRKWPRKEKSKKFEDTLTSKAPKRIRPPSLLTLSPRRALVLERQLSVRRRLVERGLLPPEGETACRRLETADYNYCDSIKETKSKRCDLGYRHLPMHEKQKR